MNNLLEFLFEPLIDGDEIRLFPPQSLFEIVIYLEYTAVMEAKPDALALSIANKYWALSLTKNIYLRCSMHDLCADVKL